VLWQDNTTGALKMAFAEAKMRSASDFNGKIGRTVDLYLGAFSEYFEAPASSTMDENRNPAEGTGGGHFQRYMPNAWENGKGPMLPLYFNFVRRLVKLRATLFHRRPKILQRRNGALLPDSHPSRIRWLRLESKARLSSRLKLLQNMTELCESALAFAAWRTDGIDGAGRTINPRVELDVLTPDEVEVYQDDWAPGSLDACRLIAHMLPMPVDSPQNRMQQRWLVWERPGPAVPGIGGSTASDQWTCRILDGDGRPAADTLGHVVPNPLFPTNVSRYGAYPYVLFHRTPQQGRIWAPPNETYETAQIAVNLTLSYATLRQWCSGGMAVLEAQDAPAADIKQGPHRGIRVNPEEDFRYAAQPFDAVGSRAWVETLLKGWAVMDGIHPDALTLSGEAFSNAITAIAKAYDRQDLVDEREDAQAYWEDQLGLLCARLVMVHNAHCAPAERIDEDIEYGVEWAEVPVPTSPLEREQAFQAACNSGIDDPVSRRMRENTSLSREQAEADFRACAAINIERSRLMQDAGQRQTTSEPAGGEQ